MFKWLKNIFSKKKKNIDYSSAKEIATTLLNLEHSFMHMSYVYQDTIVSYQNLLKAIVLMNNGQVKVSQTLREATIGPETALKIDLDDDMNLVVTIVEAKLDDKQV